MGGGGGVWFSLRHDFNAIVELCAIRNTTECGVLSRADACKLIIPCNNVIVVYIIL